jgi:hypothetical protein
MSIVWAQFDITVAALIEVIHDLTTYRVRYDKACRAKGRILALYGEMERIKHKSTEIVKCHIIFQPRH